MIESFIEWVQTNALFTGVLGAIVGAAAQAAYDRRKESNKKSEQRDAYLRYWREELDYNKSILHKMKTYIGGPRSPWTWHPLQSFSKHFRKTAWESIVKEGLLSDFSSEDQRFYRITHRSILDVALEIDVRIANYPRVETWQMIDERENNPQPASVELFYGQSNTEIEQRIQYALDNINKVLNTLTKD